MDASTHDDLPQDQRPLANPIDQRVGGAIRRRRLQLDLNLIQAAEAANVEPVLLDAYESGRARALAEHLRRIAVALRVPPARFFDPASQE